MNDILEEAGVKSVSTFDTVSVELSCCCNDLFIYLLIIYFLTPP